MYTWYLCTNICVCVCVCTHAVMSVCSPIDCSPSGFSVHGIFQARILKYVAISYSRGSSWPGDWIHITCISWIGRRILYHECHLGSHGFPGGSDGKESTCSVVDLDSVPGFGRSPGGGHGNPLQYSCLETLMDQKSLMSYSPLHLKESNMTAIKHSASLVAQTVRKSVCNAVFLGLIPGRGRSPKSQTGK